jgi:quercetin 2,3-dioxygenase
MDKSKNPILSVEPLTFPWKMEGPFLFCAHHNDKYPAGDEAMAPQASLAGRELGSDFSGKDGFSMYHGLTVPGFPQHPHRGFETVTIARRGYIDHSDSMGAKARFGQGDVQWITTGAGVVHSEMFPLVEREHENPTELFQIWLNLPKKSKMVEPHFAMFWAHQLPRYQTGSPGHAAELTVIAGSFEGLEALPPPPHSWASEPEGEVQIWSLRLDSGAKLRLPAASASSRRNLYFFLGSKLEIQSADGEAQVFSSPSRIRVAADAELELRALDGPVEVLVLGGHPIGEPVAQYGPFVMNTRQELEQTLRDYSRTRFGGWPWPSDAPVHSRESTRFAVHGDGRFESPDGSTQDESARAAG